MGGLFTLIIVAAVFYFIWKWSSAPDKATETEWGYLGKDKDGMRERQYFLGYYDRKLETYEEKEDKRKVEGTHRILEESEKCHYHDKLKIINIVKPKQAGAWGVFETNTFDCKIYYKSTVTKLTSMCIVFRDDGLEYQPFIRSVINSVFTFESISDEFTLKLWDHIMDTRKQLINFLDDAIDAMKTGDSTVVSNSIDKAKEIIRHKNIPTKFNFVDMLVLVKSSSPIWSIGIIPKSLADNYDEPEEVKVQFQNSKSNVEDLLKSLLNFKHGLENQEKISELQERILEEKEELEKAKGMKALIDAEIERRAANKEIPKRKKIDE